LSGWWSKWPPTKIRALWLGGKWTESMCSVWTHWIRLRQFTSCRQIVHMRWAVTQKVILVNDVLRHSPHQLAILTSWYWVRRSPCMAFLPPSGGVFRLSHFGVMTGYPMQTVFRFSRFVADLAIKKSPHNSLNLTILSGMALVRVRYVAIRKLKACSDSFGSRAGTLNKYVILNCWDRLPQKSSRVNKKFWKYDTFGSLQEKTRETLAKRERTGRCQPSWQNYEMLKNFCCFYCGFQK